MQTSNAVTCLSLKKLASLLLLQVAVPWPHRRFIAS